LIRAAELSGAGEALRSALSTVHHSIMANYGADPMIDQVQAGQTVRLTEEGPVVGDAVELGVLDAADTVCAVIRNGVDLGVKIAILGGYSLRDNIGAVIDEG
jgi:hypothetical protein